MNRANLAPVLISVYDRLDCLQNAIYALKQNSLAKDTFLYIVSDYAYEAKHIPIIEQIRRYIQTIDGFRDIKPIFWDKNKGSFDSVNDAIKYVLTQHDKIILFEDDIIVSNRFLEYMNNALELYKDDQRIMSIASHAHYKKIAYKNYPYDIYLSEIFSPWGVGIWKDRYFSIDNKPDFSDFFANQTKIKQFNSISRHMLPILQDMIEKGKKYGDVIVCYNMFNNTKYKYTIVPTQTLSINKGHDGRGEHCGKHQGWQNQTMKNNFCPKLQKDIPFDIRIKRNIYKAYFSYRSDMIIPILKQLKIYKPLRFLYKTIKRSNQ